MTTQGTPAMASAAATDNVYKWVEERDGYLLSLRLPEGLKLEDFSVCVDGKRRLTITDRRKPTPGNGKAQLNKKFQLPKTAKPDNITGRFDGVTLTLTVPTKGSQKPAVTTAATTAAKKEEEPKAKEEPTEAKAEREKKLIDTAVVAFKLGVLFSHRLFSSRN